MPADPTPGQPAPQGATASSGAAPGGSAPEHAWRTGDAPRRVAQAGVVRTFQLTKALSRLTVLQNMLLVAQGQRGESFLRALVPSIWRGQERENTEKALDLLTRFKLDRKKDDFAGTLSGGQR